MPTDYHELRKKYPKWAHRKDEHKKRRRKSKRRRRRARKKKRQQAGTGTSTEGMLMSLLHQLMLGGTLAKKHGENVVTGYADKVKADALAPVRSRAAMRDAMAEPQQQGGAGAGAGAVAAIGPVRARSPSPRPGGYPYELWD